MPQDYIANILADRYATPEITSIFSERGKVMAERGLWLAVMKGQKNRGRYSFYRD